MIRILVDLRQTMQPLQGALLADNAGAYVAVRQAIRAALDNQAGLVVYVTDPLLAQWLADLRRYPAKLVFWQEAQSAAYFERLFGIPPAAPFTPHVLDELELEALAPPPPQAAIDPVSWVLVQRVDPVWGYTTPPAQHLSAIVAWAVARQDWHPGAYAPLVAHQLVCWATNDSGFARLHAETLPADAARLLAGSALTRYNEHWRREHTIEITGALDLKPLEAQMRAALQSWYGTISSYWNNRYTANSSAQEIELALIQMSGLSMAEADALAYMLKQHPTAITRALLDQIDTLFAPLPEADRWRVLLREQVVPPVPDVPSDSWDTSRWLRWATDEYLPYFAWVIRTGQPREHQIACALLFSDWIYANYQRWINADPSPLVVQQHRRMRELIAAEPQSRVLWLVIDGMAWWHGQLLRPLCQQRGLYAREHTAAIAALPSITSIAKRVLTTGVPTEDLAEPTVAAAAKAQFANSGISAHVTYRLPEALYALEHGQAQCVMVLFNTIDDIAHQSRTFTDDAGVRGYLADLADHLAQARDICARNGQQLHILIGSDHGGTLLPESAVMLPLPQRTQPIEEQTEGEISTPNTTGRSARAAIIADPQQIPAEQRARWYVLDRDRFQLDQHYLAPRGYDYISRRPSGWTHGGLTPEEVVVPLLHLSPQAPHIMPIQLQWIGTMLPRRESVVRVLMRNSNRFPLEHLTLEVDGNVYDRRDQLGPTTSVELELTLPAVATQASETPVVWSVRYRTFGVEHRDHGQTMLAMRRLSTEDSNFDDMFD